MVNPKDKKGDETQINDLDVFEEWEEGQEDEGTEPGADDVKEEGGEEGDELPDFAGFEKMEAEPEGPAAEEPLPEDFSESLAGLAPDVPVSLVAVIGKVTTNVGELMKLSLGQVVELGRPPGETVDVVAGGRLIARGELVDMDGKLGVRILKMVK
ncbi:MAG: FliM/FliN family flagellar motor switch protein [Proteobacteria bacterium]|nr:FliM/FliN family flagellar motor switch protein [Pseudomonadota bacterium]